MMDLDDIFPTAPASAPTLGEDLSQLSVVDLEERIAALKSEIARVEAEVESRQSHRSAAEQAFKS